ncbi:MAG: aspartate-semialdehyde dehydrogenase [Rhodospirillaceae bacterium]|jgi:aspartate-semialdehyde dehydrogenase|nr:aspartate-semialdehyde dehydrogenase [Rhodospirillaceae bacterium]MBT5241905.1 aspartate-semialdehyde dehydrogenase [Rhodospirillaceae bacterium]MBT5567054.1 aspartate-semialdehyde dehydrogenase [Rhodospirillaceae bacterium]MBT6089553.1 aspartate-semialdehyde dehydrogenase [Rhodospirillaceae bacterium]MBT6960493.1 aspartate-semialdehyde dehydrogenase [Rhodospirillaceae bacterium]
MLDDPNRRKNGAGYTVAVVGATGNVGREVLSTLWERQFPVEEVIALASARSVGAEVSYGEGEVLTVQDLAKFDFTGVDIVLSSPGAKVSAEYSPKAAAAGAVVIDNTSHFRMDPDVPLIVPEVNAAAIAGYKKKGIIANPNCSTIQMVVALKPLHDAFGIKRVVVSTYQSTSGAGKEGMDELFNQTKGIYVNQPSSESQEVFPKQIAFNVIPHIDSFMDDGATKEEWKMMVETKKILGPKIKVHANCARVPTFIGHAEYVNIETEKPMDDNEVRAMLKKAPGITVVDHRLNEGYVTPAEVPGEDSVYVSRIRSDATVDNGLSFWCVSDNLRKGAALNAVQIAELLVRKHLSVSD